MITKFNIFEEKKNEPQVGDYVICQFEWGDAYDNPGYHDSSITDPPRSVSKLNEFLESNIGRVITRMAHSELGWVLELDCRDSGPYGVTYENIPDSLKNYFTKGNGEMTYNNKTSSWEYYNSLPPFRGFFKDEIVYFSKNKEDVERFMKNYIANKRGKKFDL